MKRAIIESSDPESDKVKPTTETIVQCVACLESFPQEIFDECNEGECLHCAVQTYCGSKKFGETPFWIREGICQRCGDRLVSVDYSKADAKYHGDWDSQTYHKKCWIEIKKEEGY